MRKTVEPFTAARRRALLDESFSLTEALLDLELSPPGEREEAQAPLRARLRELEEAYREGLPSLPLGRCPYCGASAVRSIDPFGLDGLWWRHDDPVRARGEELEVPCPHYVALLGAVKLGEPIEAPPFLVKPGPEVPFVVPRLLDHEGARAVIASLEVGPHQAFAITYFADPAAGVERIPEWGAAERRFVAPDGTLAWSDAEIDERDVDTKLTPRLYARSALWIAPGDESLTLQREVSGCPYLGLTGRRTITRLQDGKVWSE